MRGKVFVLVAATALLLVSPVRADEAEDLAFASKRGAELFAYDRAAWVASDALMAELKDMPRGKPAGWVVTPSAEGGLEVSFVADDQGTRYKFYVASVRENKVVATLFTTRSNEGLTETQQAMLRARDVALEAERPSCQAQPFNTVVLPGRAGGGAMDVYLLTPQVDAAVFPVGGHTRVSVGADGAITAKHDFLNTCLALDTGEIPEGGTNAVYVVSHLNDPLPTEIHVFLSIWMQAPIVVAIGETKKSWIVQGTEIGPFDAN